MKKMTAILAVLIAAVMVMGMTASAEAGKLVGLADAFVYANACQIGINLVHPLARQTYRIYDDSVSADFTCITHITPVGYGGWGILK